MLNCMAKIKIVFVLGTLEIGGTEKQFLETVRRLNRERFDPHVLALPGDGKLRPAIEALRIPLTCLGFDLPKGRYHSGALLRIARMMGGLIGYLRREQPQIVQSYLLWANIYSGLAGKMTGVPVILTGRRELMNATYRKFPDWWCQNLINRWTTMILANSEYVKQESLRLEKYVTAEKIQVLYNGIALDHAPRSLDPTVLKSACGIPPDAQVVGMIANLRPCKGHQDFLQAAALVLQRYPRTVFWLVGEDRGLQPSLERLAVELRIREAILFAGARDDISAMLAIIDVLASASLTESLSNAILEGMAQGKPIVATHVGGTPELITHGETGLLVPPQNPARFAEALNHLLGDRALQHQMGVAGRRKVEARFGMEQMIQATEAFYQKSVTNRNNYLTKA